MEALKAEGRSRGTVGMELPSRAIGAVFEGADPWPQNEDRGLGYELELSLPPDAGWTSSISIRAANAIPAAFSRRTW